MELCDELFARLHCFEISCCGDAGADFETRANVFAVVVGIFWKPADFLMIAGSFGPGDVVAGGFGFVQERNRDLFDCPAALPECP